MTNGDAPSVNALLALGLGAGDAPCEGVELQQMTSTTTKILRPCTLSPDITEFLRARKEPSTELESTHLKIDQAMLREAKETLV